MGGTQWGKVQSRKLRVESTEPGRQERALAWLRLQWGRGGAAAELDKRRNYAEMQASGSAAGFCASLRTHT